MRIILTIVIICAFYLVNFSSISMAQDSGKGTEEILLGFDIPDQTGNEIKIHVESSGCTKKEDFHVEVDNGFLTVYRINPDYCEGWDPQGVILTFSKEELGLDKYFRFVLTNKIGNTSNPLETMNQ